MKIANRKLDLILEDGSGGSMSYQEMISELKELRDDLMSKGWVSMRSLIPMVAQNAQRIGLAIADRGDLYPTPLTSSIRLARENKLEDRLSGIRTRRASDVINELESRIARLERQARPQALVELGRRGRDHLNSQVFEWLGSYGDDYKQYVAVDVEDQVEFYGTYVKLNVELEYIDRANDREKSESAVFHLTVSPRSIKQDRDGVYDEESIFKAILHTDSADLKQQ